MAACGLPLAVLALVAGWLSHSADQQWQREQQVEELARLARICHAVAAPQLGRVPALNQVVVRLARDQPLHVTIADSRGEILSDSDKLLRQSANLGHQGELRAALNDGRNVSVRSQAAHRGQMLYLAQRFGEDERRTVVRVGAPLVETPWLDGWWWGFVGVATLWTVVVVGLQYRESGKVLAAVSRVVEGLTRGEFEASQAVRAATGKCPPLASQLAATRQALRTRERKLREDGNTLAAVLGNMIEGVVATDARGHVLLANNAGRRMLAISTVDVIGRPLLELVRAPAVREAVEISRRRQQDVLREFETPGRRVLSLRVSQIAGEELSVGAILVLHDLTELRALENMRRDFVANVSHELKTPLSSIKAYSETLRMGAIHDQQRNLEFVSAIFEQSERLEQLIADLLQLARIESGHAGQELKELQIVPVIEECLKSFQHEAASRQVRLEAEIEHPDLSVRADEEGVRTIVNNLVSNALRYTAPKGLVRVAVRASHTTVILSVEDTGVGIAPEHHERIFERFYRVDRARSREMGGTGLGLAIVKHLTQVFGGAVRLRSQVGVGTELEVSLPRVTAPPLDLNQ